MAKEYATLYYFNQVAPLEARTATTIHTVVLNSHTRRIFVHVACILHVKERQLDALRTASRDTSSTAHSLSLSIPSLSFFRNSELPVNTAGAPATTRSLPYRRCIKLYATVRGTSVHAKMVLYVHDSSTLKIHRQAHNKQTH